MRWHARRDLRLDDIPDPPPPRIGSIGHVYDEDFRSAVDLLCTNRVDPAPLITHRLPLERAIEDGIGYLAGPGRSDALEFLVAPKPRLG